MAKGDQSELTEDVMALVDAMMKDVETLVQEWGKVPFMYEAISQAEYQRRFGAMTPEEKMAEIARLQGV